MQLLNIDVLNLVTIFFVLFLFLKKRNSRISGTYKHLIIKDFAGKGSLFNM